MLYRVRSLPFLLLLLYTWTSDGLPTLGRQSITNATIWTTSSLTKTQTGKYDDCDFSFNPLTAEQAGKCEQLMKADKRAFPKMNAYEVLDLSNLTEKQAEPLLRAPRIQANKMAVKNGGWTIFNLASNVTNILSGSPFRLNLENMYKMKRVDLNGKEPRNGYNLTIINCPMLKQENLNELKKKAKVSNIAPAGACKELVRNSCKSYYGTNLLIDKDTSFDLPPRFFVVPEDFCLSIVNMTLPTMALIQLPKKPVRNCVIRFENNLRQCPSQEDAMGWISTYGFSIPVNGPGCSFTCNQSELFNSNKTCRFLRGGLVIQGDNINRTLYAKRLPWLYEIRDGYLEIRDTTKVDIGWFTRLIRIDSSHQGGAMRIQNTTIGIWKMTLLAIHGKNKTIVFENNPRLQLTPEQEKSLTELSGANFYWDLKRPTVTNSTGSTISTRMGTAAATEASTPGVSRTVTSSDKDTNESTDLQKKLSTSYGAGIVVIIVIVVVLFISIVVLLSLFCWARFRSFFLPPIPRLPLPKYSLLLNLADEILEMNPLEWRRLAHHEAVSMGSRLSAQEELRLRSQYSKFVEEAEKSHIAVSVRPPPDSNNWELFKTFKQFYEENHGEAHLILLSRYKDPTKTCPLLSTEMGTKEVISGYTEEKVLSKTKSKSISTTTITPHGGQYEISTTLVSKQTLDDDIQLSKYRMSLSHDADGSPWKANFSLKLVHFHAWNEGARDATKILKMIAYGKQRTGWRKLLFGRVKRPVFMTSTPSQSYVVMMLTAVLYHVTDPTYPSMRMSEMRQLVFILLGSSYTQPESLVFLFHAILSWAAEEKCIPADRIQAFEDFQYIVEKIAAYKAINPTTLFFEPSDLNLAEDVNQRVQNSVVLKKMLESEAAASEKNVPMDSVETIESVMKAPRRFQAVATMSLDKTLDKMTSAEKATQMTMPSSSKKDKPTQP